MFGYLGLQFTKQVRVERLLRLLDFCKKLQDLSLARVRRHHGSCNLVLDDAVGHRSIAFDVLLAHRLELLLLSLELLLNYSQPALALHQQLCQMQAGIDVDLLQLSERAMCGLKLD